MLRNISATIVLCCCQWDPEPQGCRQVGGEIYEVRVRVVASAESWYPSLSLSFPFS